MNDLAAKIAQLEALRATIDGAAAESLDDAIRALRAQQATQRMEAGEGGLLINPTQTVVHGDQHNYAAPLDPSIPRQERALIDYLSALQGECGPLQLMRIDASESRHRRSMRLEQVYIGLHTTTQVELTEDEAAQQPRAARRSPSERQTRPLTALEAVARGKPPRLMLLGAPGSGKSTFVNHLVLCLAGAALTERGLGDPQVDGDWLDRLDRWRPGALLPVRVILRDFAAFPPLAESKHGSLALLLDFLRQSLGPNAEALDRLRAELTNGHAILLLDGLDEVVGETVLARLVESIADAARTYARAPVVVTCRVLDYQANPLRQIRGFVVETLAPLTDEQIDHFVGAWYDELAASGREMLGNAEALRGAIASRTELRSLAELPLLLTMMAVVHAGKGRLPDARALLYDECIELLLLRWRQDPGQPDMLERLDLPQFRASDLLALMARLGFAAHEAAERDPEQAVRPADLRREQVRSLLEEAFTPYSAGDPLRRDELVSLVLHAIAMRNGLLLKQSGEQGESYAFPHRTFQEFLAGYHLKGQRDYRRLCLERSPKAHWHEALALMVGYQVLADRELEKPLDLVEKLLARSRTEQALAGELLVLIGRERAANYDAALVGKDGLWPRARTTLLRLAATGRAPEAPATLRVRAGLALGLLCYGSVEALCRADTRIPLPDRRLPLAVVGVIDPGSAAWRQALDAYWCPIAPGPFWYGDDTQKSARLQQVTLPYAYKVARYPVTNADFARFVAAGGYAERRWWTENGWAYIQPGGTRYYEGESERIELPRLWSDARYNNPAQPVVGVSWYEAAAYCAWLTEHGHRQGWLPAAEEIRLPTSLEWERAARHTDRRRYPWGTDEPTPERANYDKTDIDTTSPVGCFPAGVAECGAHDLLGNIWEWTTTLWEEIELPIPRKEFTQSETPAIRGNAYHSEMERMFCGARLGFNPGNGVDYRGFRVVCSPRSSG
ncbi:MAG: SUMF1/EgtB/PvdO family nonheme iron enzyme [Kouleothrix sp.]|nr:SUMF1/EgtB/PvdO family nonheme iron enzyme [Kouleothrix sp.]